MSSKTRLYAAVFVLAAPITFAVPAIAAESNAADARASVPPVQYESAFSSYPIAQEIETRNWREANAEVMGGGHAGHSSHSNHTGGAHDMADMHSAMPGEHMDHSMRDAPPADMNKRDSKQHDGHRH